MMNIELVIINNIIELQTTGLPYTPPQGGAVDSVNGKTGDVTLDADDLDAYTKSETNSLIATKANTSDLSSVATSGRYDDLDNKPTIPTIPTNVSAFTNDAGYLTQHQDISGKVDKEAGKGLSTNDYSNTDKSKVSKIVTDGVGDKYLSDDGNYKTVSGGGGAVSSVNTKTGAVVLTASDVGAVSAAGVVTEVGKFLKVNGTGTAPIASSSRAVALGYGANANGGNSIAIGVNTTAGNASAIAIGSGATAAGSYSGAIAIGNTSYTIENGLAIGDGAKSSSAGVAIGAVAKAQGLTSTAVGAVATTLTYTSSTALGYQATVTANNQVQLGNSETTTYAYGAVQDRSDIRDKADIQDCTLGLDFINALRPVKYKWDYREDYARDLFPHIDRDDYETDEAYQSALEQQQIERCAFFQNPVKDGSKTRSREHCGLIAQEFKQVLDTLGIDHAAYQDHSVNGGMDVKSIGYAELIPNLIKAIQELSAKVDALESKG